MSRFAAFVAFFTVFCFAHTLSAADFSVECQAAHGEGVPRSMPWTPQEQICVMATLRDFALDEDFTFIFKPRITITRDGELVHDFPLPNNSVKCTPETRAFHCHFQYDKPLPPGEYELRLTVRDVIGQEDAVYDIPLTVLATPDFRLHNLRVVSAGGTIRPPVYLEGTPMRIQWLLAPAMEHQVTVSYSLASSPKRIFEKWQGTVRNTPQVGHLSFIVPGPGTHRLIIHAENHTLSESVTYEIPFRVVAVDENEE